MSKTIGLISLLFLTINGYSQLENKIRFGIKTGLAFSTLKLEYPANGSSDNPGTKTSLTLGVFVNVPLNKSLVFQPNVLFLTKGAGYDGINYFEIPLDLLFKSQTKNGFFLLGGGLSPAFKVSNYYVDNTIKQFDLGLHVLAAYQTPIGFSINLGYTYGLLNLSNNKDILTNFQNRYFSICAGYEF